MTGTKRIPYSGGDEVDAMSRNARRIIKVFDKPGIAKKSKQSYNRRFRKAVKHEAHEMAQT